MVQSSYFGTSLYALYVHTFCSAAMHRVYARGVLIHMEVHGVFMHIMDVIHTLFSHNERLK